MTKIGVAAQSFGFGPASKASMIMTDLTRHNASIEPVVLADGIAHEFLTREELGLQPSMHPSSRKNCGKLRELCSDLSASIVALDPDWVNFLNERCPVFFVDSLGFMWGKDFFDNNPALSKVEKYFVQDVFGAYERLRRMGIPNLISVGAIIEPEIDYLTIPQNKSAMVVHLGGLLNTVTDRSPKTYLSLINNILAEVRPQIGLILMSATARNTLEWTFDIKPTTLTHAQTLKEFRAATSVLTSPGLTTLLELTAMRVPTIPLPPQNMSQAVIISNVCRSWTQAPTIWRLLSEEFGDLTGFPEQEGVKRVSEINSRLLKSTTFCSAYGQALHETLSNPVPIPTNIASDFNRVKTCSRHILDRLKS